MSIPLDQLYPYIESIAKKIHKDHVLIYRFYPHGSKKIEDLKILKPLSYLEMRGSPAIYCNDQEPLNYNLYKDHSNTSPELQKLFEKYSLEFSKFNFQGEIIGIWDQALLLHSEQRSDEVTKYKLAEFIPIYYWAHAIIAKDWFRFAEHTTQIKQIQKTFLIYNRAWSGTREYRLKFAELLIKLNLEIYCKMNISPVEPELKIHYSQHKFSNTAWCPELILEDYFLKSTADSHYSADFDINDYNSTNIEVVLETLFDDSRLHLTEKSLRPIACGQPFILAGTHGSLEYLRSYGFKTFGHIWDESYDQEIDPQSRLSAIVNLMKQIAGWTLAEQKQKLKEAHIISNYNKQYFFSKEFNNIVTDELVTNLTTGFDLLEKNNTSKFYMDRIEKIKNIPELYQYVEPGTPDKGKDIDIIFKKAKKYYMRRCR